MADAYRIKDQYNAYFITLTIIDWVDVFTLNPLLSGEFPPRVSPDV